MISKTPITLHRDSCFIRNALWNQNGQNEENFQKLQEYLKRIEKRVTNGI